MIPPCLFTDTLMFLGVSFISDAKLIFFADNFVFQSIEY